MALILNDRATHQGARKDMRGKSMDGTVTLNGAEVKLSDIVLLEVYWVTRGSVQVKLGRRI